MRRWFWIALLCSGLIAALLFLSPWGYRYLVNTQSYFTGTGYAGVTQKRRLRVGQQLAWRTLCTQQQTQLDQDGCLGGLIIGNFDKDPDQEVLRIGRNSAQLFEASGESRPSGLRGAEFDRNACAWDFDGDGVDEVLADALGSFIAQQSGSGGGGAGSTLTPTDTWAWSLAGECLGSLPAANISGRPLLGSFEHSGTEQMLFVQQQKNSSEALIFTAGGQQLGPYTIDKGLPLCCIDVNGDGVDEVLMQSGTTRGRLLALGLPHGRREFSYSGLLIDPVAAELDGQPGEELITSAGWLRFSDMHFTAFAEQGTAAKGAKIRRPGPGAPTAQPVILDLLADNPGPEVVLADRGSSALTAYAADGRMLYFEEMGALMENCCKLHSGGVDYLVVQQADRLLICP